MSPRIYELAIAEVIRLMYDEHGPDNYGDYRESAAKIVDMVTRLIYAGETLEQPKNDRSDCPVCHGATCFHWSEGVDMPGCICYPEKEDREGDYYDKAPGI